MVFFRYDANILPTITLIGQDIRTGMHQNIRRVSEDYIFYLVTEGEMFFNEGGIDYHLHKGDCFLFEPDILHFGTQDSRYQIRYIHFHHPAIERIETDENAPTDVSSQGFVTLPKRLRIEDVAGSKRLLATIGDAITRSYTRLENWEIDCACLVQQAFLQLRRLSVLSDQKQRGISEQRMYTIISYLYDNHSRKLTGAVLEKELSYNFDYLNQQFHRFFNVSIFQMLETIRMEISRNLLLTTDYSVERIATEVGYKDASYFSKVFKKRTGLSPVRYRHSTETATF
ncbi:MAG: helix-turn-helix domain-containing protein [Ruminococcaceae bacterium]|nr:helix-turn-helix domain-containing protein [Oscillospiraceae bacterium]